MRWQLEKHEAAGCERLGASLSSQLGSSAAGLAQDPLLRDCRMFPLLTWHFNLLVQGGNIVLFFKRGGLTRIAARSSRGWWKTFHAPLSDLRREEFSSSTFFSDTEITTRCIDPKIAWNHESGPSRSRKVGCGIKGPICFPFADLYFSFPTQPEQPDAINYPKALQISGKLHYLALCFTPTNDFLPKQMFCCMFNMFGRSRKQDCCNQSK